MPAHARPRVIAIAQSKMRPTPKLRVLSVLLLAAVSLVHAELGSDHHDKEVCYPVVGCFTLEEPWKSLLRPIPAPMDPEKIDTKVYFYSRPDTHLRYNITMRPQIELNNAPFDRTRPTIIITHGFAADGNSSWMSDLKDAFLSRVDANVFLTDWGKGSSLLNYLQVSGNTRVVGKELARLVKDLNVDPKKLHFVGHSLGAHISSYAAKDTPGTARITALDPAQPAFEGFDRTVRLDPSDAVFVDVVHTDARPLIPTLGFGMITPAGHVDFYMNGGFDQPGCIIPDPSKLPKITSLADLARYPVEVFSEAVTCPHGRSYLYFTEALNSTEECIFWGHQTSVLSVSKAVANALSQGLLTKVTALSSSCSREDCTPLGLRTKLSGLRGSFVVTTKGRAPFCVKEHGVPPETGVPTVSASTPPSIFNKVISKIPFV